ncbi:AAA family ATPase [Alkaliphilus serpentinus]|uniref:AAA family ATPase n=1 Tax=Alkaliphilus serpentinus TaxID=1482731 RepID=A0A833M6X4_9FIRM|nr:AAA family ATPase [Alkaliphilus serpentinus]KAB3529203.1 AAA family ATPase [Alkaliphilus serpentinus]
MRIKELEMLDFGKFHMESAYDTDSRVVLFLGNNEAGKTTIFNLIKSALYGFSPASNDKHPYSSWNHNRIEFTAKLDLKDEGEIQLYRRLLSQPKGHITKGENIIDLRNNPLPHVRHVSSEIYEKIYALRVEDLMELQGKAWDEVQDKLLANYGSKIIRNTREVLKELNEEASQIYKESRRGNSLLRDLEEEMNSLKSQRESARERQRLLRDYNKRLEEIYTGIEGHQREKVRLKEYMRRVKELLPLRGLLKELEETKKSFVYPEIFKQLLSNSLSKKEDLEERQKQLNRTLEEKKKLIDLKKDGIYRLTEEELKILDHKANINTHIKNISRIQTLRDIVSNKREEKRRIIHQLNYEGQKITGEEVSQRALEGLENFNLSELRIRLENYRRSLKEFEDTKGSIDYLRKQTINVTKPKVLMIAALAGIPILGAGILLNQDLLNIIGAIMIIAGGVAYGSFEIMKRQLEGNNPQRVQQQLLTNKLKEIEEKLMEKKQLLLNLFDGINVPEIVITNMDEVFASSLIKIKDDSFRLKELEKSLKEKEEELEKEIKVIDEFLQIFDAVEGSGDDKLYKLKELVEGLEKRVLVNEGLTNDLLQLQEEVKGIEANLQDTDNSLDTLNSALMTMGDGDINKGIESFHNNQRLQNKLKILDEKLMAIDNLAHLKEELEGLNSKENETFDDLNITKVEEELEEIEEGLIALKEEQRELQLLSQQILKETTIDEIESQIKLKEMEYEEAAIKRDRLMLLAEIIKVAEEEFKEENQPDVLKNAGAYFNLITLGKYTNIYIEETDKDPSIMVKEIDSPTAIKVTPAFSKGTLNQLYLSLRLSLMDHLDKEGLMLPVCFDEAFINWDEHRLDSNLQLLQKISEKRQIFFFTCHSWLAEKIEKAFNIKKILLT